MNLKRLPTPWCPGCGLNSLLIQTAGLLKENTVAFSGIGCTARATGFLDVDSVNGLHGRAIPLAEGCKLANLELNVIVFSGDGDLTGIGGNHLLHASRRNTDLTIICSANEIYGMTGGQMSPLTKKGVKTLTSPKGAPFAPINVQGLLMSNKNYFYARTSVAHPMHMIKCIKLGLEHKGFSFVEILNPCYTNLGARIGFNSVAEMLKELKEKYTIVEKDKLEEFELGIVKKI